MDFFARYGVKNSFIRRVLILGNEQGVDRGDQSEGAEGASQCKVHLFKYFQLQKCVCTFVWSLQGNGILPWALLRVVYLKPSCFALVCFILIRAIVVVSKHPSLALCRLFIPPVWFWSSFMVLSQSKLGGFLLEGPWLRSWHRWNQGQELVSVPQVAPGFIQDTSGQREQARMKCLSIKPIISSN